MSLGRHHVDARVWVALGLVYVVWGSTYLGIRVVVRTMPPFLGMGLRFVTAGLLLGAFLVARDGWSRMRLTRGQLAAVAVVGSLLLVGGNGLVAVAEQHVESALAALMVAAVPLWVVVLRLGARERPALWTVAGTLVGFGGIAVLAGPGGGEGGTQTWGIALLVLGPFLWSVGSFVAPRFREPVDAFSGTAWQMLIGGGAMLVVSVLADEWSGFSFGDVSAASWWAWVYLTTIGSLVGFTAFVYALGHGPLSLVSTYAFVNPVVAVALGALILDEAVTAAIVLGGGLAVVGVALVVLGESRPRSAPPDAGPSDATPPVT